MKTSGAVVFFSEGVERGWGGWLTPLCGEFNHVVLSLCPLAQVAPWVLLLHGSMHLLWSVIVILYEKNHLCLSSFLDKSF